MITARCPLSRACAISSAQRISTPSGTGTSTDSRSNVTRSLHALMMPRRIRRVSIDRRGFSLATAHLGGLRLASVDVGKQERQPHAHEVGEAHMPPPFPAVAFREFVQLAVRRLIDSDGAGRSVHGSTLASRQTRMTRPCVLTRSEVRTPPVHSHRNPSGGFLNTLPAAFPRAA